jgi:hypothetical protein
LVVRSLWPQLSQRVSVTSGNVICDVTKTECSIGECIIRRAVSQHSIQHASLLPAVRSLGITHNKCCMGASKHARHALCMQAAAQHRSIRVCCCIAMLPLHGGPILTSEHRGHGYLQSHTTDTKQMCCAWMPPHPPVCLLRITPCVLCLLRTTPYARHAPLEHPTSLMPNGSRLRTPCRKQTYRLFTSLQWFTPPPAPPHPPSCSPAGQVPCASPPPLAASPGQMTGGP